jgi:putative protease
MESGVTSFKVEGRMKSAYYAAVTANAYRMAMDAYTKDPEGYRYDPAWLTELESVSHREYCTGYWFHEPLADAQTVTQPGYLKEKGYLAVVDSYDASTGRAVLIQKNKFCEGDTVEHLTPGSVGKPMTVTEMADMEGNPIPACPHPQMRFTAAVPYPVKAGDILRSV